MKIKNILTVLGILVGGQILAQQNIQAFYADSLQIEVDSARGQFQWQISYDSINWSPIAGQQTVVLSTIADSFPAFFRLEITEGSCDPWYSEVLQVNEATALVCGDSVSHGFVAGITPDGSIAFAFRTYTTVQANWPGLGGNKCWTKMNIGALVEADSATDPNPDAAGWYFQFNRSQGYALTATGRIPNTTWINPINENLDWQPANDPCTQYLGGDWRIPTQAEWNAFLNASTANGGVGGQTGLIADAFASTLKLHAGGNLSGGDGSSANLGNWGLFWSGVQNSNNTAGSFRFSGVGSFPVNATKNFGYPVRCILDTP
ncbi:MAG: hypothetical protein JJU02_14190 [Cryomorphaceae bacterium]|nr:hypothetical protein [Cryomorphaceae bacterium]